MTFFEHFCHSRARPAECSLIEQSMHGQGKTQEASRENRIENVSGRRSTELQDCLYGEARFPGADAEGFSRGKAVQEMVDFRMVGVAILQGDPCCPLVGVFHQGFAALQGSVLGDEAETCVEGVVFRHEVAGLDGDGACRGVGKAGDHVARSLCGVRADFRQVVTRRLAEEPVGDVQVVDGEIEEGAAALHLVVEPVVPAPGGGFGEAPGVEDEGLAQAPGFYSLFEVAVLGHETADVGDHEPPVGAFRRLDHGLPWGFLP